MKKTAIVATVCLAGGFAAARWLAMPVDGAEDRAPDPAREYFDSSLPLAERLAELERAVGAERQARQLLQDEVLYLTGEIERLSAEAPAVSSAGPAPGDADTGEEPPAATRRSRVGWSSSTDYQIERLVDAGFSEDRAAWIVQRESQFRMAMLEARHAAQRNGSFDDYNETLETAQESFRSELGNDYERYLEGMGRPTSVVVGGVMDTSPAQRAGLKPGDLILSYGGNRIYSMSDLNRATFAGNDGETVYVQIERDGMPMQLALPRGPLGITGGGRRRGQ